MTEETEIDTEDKMYGKWELILQYALPRMWFAPNQFRNTLIEDIKQLQTYMQNHDFKNFSISANKIERRLNEGRFTTILSLFIDTYEQIEEFRIIEINDLRNRIESLEKQLSYLKNNSPEILTNYNQYTEEGKLIKEKTCLVCKASFKSHRKNSIYCSHKCKQAAYRARKENKTID
jgi:hypothetical protein